MKAALSGPSRLRSMKGRTAACSVLEVCITPLGSPVVPEVYISSTTSSDPGRPAAKIASASSSSSQRRRSEEHTSELQSLMRISYAVFCLKKKKKIQENSKSTARTKVEVTNNIST